MGSKAIPINPSLFDGFTWSRFSTNPSCLCSQPEDYLMKRAFAALPLLALIACGPIQFTPTEYPIDKGNIAQFDLKGNVQVVNGQPSEDKAVVYSYGGTQLVTTLKALTESMVNQTAKEIAANSRKSDSGQAKSVELKIDSMLSKYFMFHFNSTVKFTVKLGNGKVLNKTVEHTSGTAQQDLNGCIADSVVNLLSDPDVKSYLAE